VDAEEALASARASVITCQTHCINRKGSAMAMQVGRSNHMISTAVVVM
jgi:hypothetical protein